MTTVTIPKHLAERDDLIALPRFDYEELLVVQKTLKARKTFTATSRERRLIAKGRRAFKLGKFVSLSKL